MQTFRTFIVLVFYIFCLGGCAQTPPAGNSMTANTLQDTIQKPVLYIDTVIVPYNVVIAHYFRFMDSLEQVYDTLKLTEHMIVRANPWIIDSFVETDYYSRKERGEFVFDQKKLIILKQGDTIFIPNDTLKNQIITQQKNTWLDINIPEFRLRIVKGSDTLFTFPVRVGQNRARYLESVGKVMNLRTKVGRGSITGYYFKDFFINPVDNKKFTQTRRDDDTMTMMPLLPWIEPTINGECWGQLIHATTNENTLGKAYSNGCIGTREGDIWRVYYYAPIDTKVVIRYNRYLISETDTLVLKDVYSKKTFKKD
jgi:L,D-transpeptidase ErfK/SrfK